MAIRRNRAVSKLAKIISADGTFSSESLADDFVLRVDVYDSVGELPITNLVNGTQAFVPSAKRFYLSDGNGWYSVSAVNSTPTIQSILDSDGNLGPFGLSSDGLPTVVTVTVLDSDADPLSYTFSKDANFDGLGTITQDNNVFTITPFSFDSATSESGTVTFTITDDVNIAASTQTFTLSFYEQFNDATNLSGGQWQHNEYPAASVYVHQKSNILVLGNWNDNRIMFYDISNVSNNTSGAPTHITSEVSGGANVHHLEYNNWLIMNQWTTNTNVFDLSNPGLGISSSGTFSLPSTAKFDRSIVEFAEKYNYYPATHSASISLHVLDPSATSANQVINTTATTSLNLGRNNGRSLAWDEDGQFFIRLDVDGYCVTVSATDLGGAPYLTKIAERSAGPNNYYVSSIDAKFRTAWHGQYNIKNLYYGTWNQNGTINSFTNFNRVAAGGRDVNVAQFTARDGILYLSTAESPTYLEVWDYRSGTPSLQSIINMGVSQRSIGANENTLDIYNGFLYGTHEYLSINQSAVIF